ncbi:MAG: hypothetical protein WC521_01215 [Bdellovibrionales bacterium]
MMRSLLFTILISCFILPADALGSEALPEASLFFTSQEMREAGMLTRKIPPVREGEIHLGAVVYYGPDDWTLWLQGTKWTPETEQSDLRVLEVTANDVRLLWRGENGKEAQEILLKPNQSFEIATGKVISQP